MDQTALAYLTRMAEDWRSLPYQAISNEGEEGQEFLGHLTALLESVAAPSDGAAWRITAYLDARRRFPIHADQMAECKIGGQNWTYLTVTDLRAVLADLTRAEAENERLTAQVDELADFDKADERLRTLQAERDKAVTMWHEQHKELAETKAKLAAASRALAANACGETGTGAFSQPIGPCTRPLAHFGAHRAADGCQWWPLDSATPRCAFDPPCWECRRKAREAAQSPAAAVDGAQAATGARMAHGDAERGQEEPQPSKAATGTTRAGIEAPVASGEPDAIGGGR